MSTSFFCVKLFLELYTEFDIEKSLLGNLKKLSLIAGSAVIVLLELSETTGTFRSCINFTEETLFEAQDMTET